MIESRQKETVKANDFKVNLYVFCGVMTCFKHACDGKLAVENLMPPHVYLL